MIDHDHDRAEVGHQHDDQRSGRRRGPAPAAPCGGRGARWSPASTRAASSIAMPEDDRDLGELGGLEREAAAEHDPGVRAVDRGAERGEHQQDQQHRERRRGTARRVRRVRWPSQTVPIIRANADAGVQQVPDQEVVRVALVELGAVAGRGVDQQRADAATARAPRAAAASPAGGRAESRAKQPRQPAPLRGRSRRRRSCWHRSCRRPPGCTSCRPPRVGAVAAVGAAGGRAGAPSAARAAGPPGGPRSGRVRWRSSGLIVPSAGPSGRRFCGRGQQRLLLVDRAVVVDAVQRLVDVADGRSPEAPEPVPPWEIVMTIV